MTTVNRLVTKALEERTISLLVQFPQIFLSVQEKQWLDWIRKYTMHYGQVPTVERMQREFSSFISTDAEDPLLDLYDQCLVFKRKQYILSYLMEKQDELRDSVDPSGLIKALAKVLDAPGGEVELYSEFDRTFYMSSPIAFPYYIPELDHVTGGVAQTDLVYLSGVAATNKTTYLKWLAATWYTHNKRILFLSNENPASTIIGGIDATLGSWNPKKMRTGGWTDSDRAKIQAITYISKLSRGEIIVPKRPVSSVAEIYPMSDEYDPDIVIVDGAYLMSALPNAGGKGWEREQAMSRALKRFTLDKNKPVIATLQQGRGGWNKKAERSEVAGTIDYERDADIFLATSIVDRARSLEILKNRWGEDGGIGFDVTLDFTKMTISLTRALYVEGSEGGDE
jgi:hypothetical protein